MKTIKLTERARTEGLVPGTSMDVSERLAAAWISNGIAIDPDARQEAPPKRGRPRKQKEESPASEPEASQEE